MDIKKIKFLLLIGIISITSFLLGLSVNEAKADTNEFNNIQGDLVNTQTLYIDGQKYVVFTSSKSSMFVIKK